MRYLILLFTLSILIGSACTNSKYVEGLKVTKFENGIIFTDDGREIPFKPQGFEDATSILLARHTEAIPDIENPGLTDEGLARAEKLAALVFPLDIQEVFMTSLRRTIFTAKPLAMVYDLPVSTYNTEQYDRVVEKIFGKRNGTNVIIYGHSNTTPQLINKIIGEEKYENIPHEEYDNLFIVHSNGVGEEAVVYKFKY